jgi:RNase P subunit RPR2
MNTRSTLVDRTHADKRLAVLLEQAPLEFARAVYGINDLAGGRTETMASREVARAQRQGVALTEERAEQRARAYLPTMGQEHCPRCWVVYGQKTPLRFRKASEEQPEVASCHSCGAEYATSPD